MPVVNGIKDRVGVGFPPKGAATGDVCTRRNPEVFPPEGGANIGTAAIGVGDPVRVKRTGTEGVVRQILHEDPYGENQFESWVPLAKIDTDRYKGLFFSLASLEKIAPPPAAAAAADGEWLSCPTCGREAMATEWPEVLSSKDGATPRVCPDCDTHNLYSVPVPARRDRPEPRTPKVGDRVRDKGNPHECPGGIGAGVVKEVCRDFKPTRYYVQNEHRIRAVLPEDLEPADLVAAVVVRGLGSGETAAVVLCRSEEEAVREQRANGGVVVGSGQIVWA